MSRETTLSLAVNLQFCSVWPENLWFGFLLPIILQDWGTKEANQSFCLVQHPSDPSLALLMIVTDFTGTDSWLNLRFLRGLRYRASTKQCSVGVHKSTWKTHETTWIAELLAFTACTQTCMDNLMPNLMVHAILALENIPKSILHSSVEARCLLQRTFTLGHLWERNNDLVKIFEFLSYKAMMIMHCKNILA